MGRRSSRCASMPNCSLNPVDKCTVLLATCRAQSLPSLPTSSRSARSSTLIPNQHGTARSSLSCQSEPHSNV